MAPGGTQFVVLCEDRMHEIFVYRYLIKRGHDRRRIRIVPWEGGSGEQFVRKRFPDEVKAYRGKRNHLAVALIVVTDADNLTVDSRRQTLADALREAELAPLAAGERIANLIPKRNIETWVHHLVENDVDEDTNYKRHYRDRSSAARQCATVAKVLDAHRSTSPACCPPSLVAGHEELQRVV